MTTAKCLTVPEAPEEGVVDALAATLDDAGIDPGDVDLLIHGTTLATNTIIERRGAVSALVTTAGFRDVVETGYESRYDQYDLYLDKRPPLIPRRRRFGVPERISAACQVLRGLDCPIFLMSSGGGLMTLETGMRFPIRLVESGPAGGAVLAGRIAAECTHDRVVAFDMGGTTAKICLIVGFTPDTARGFEVDRAARFLREADFH